MKIQVIAHAALLLVGALLAYLAWNRPDESGAEKAVVLAELTEKDLEQLTYTWPEGEAVVSPVRQGDDTTWAVTLSYEKEQKGAAKKKPDVEEGAADAPGADAGPTEEPAEPVKVRVTERFPGGRSVGRAAKALTPLGARRSLGKVEGERLAAMGLDEPERKLEVKAKGKTWTFLVGEATYGDQARYARLEGGDDVLLIDAAAVRGLEGSPVRLMEARLVTLESEDITGMKLTSGARQAAFTHVDRDQPKKRHFVVEGAPEQRSEEAAGLLSTVRGLRAMKYVDEAALAGATPRATVTLTRVAGEPFVVTVYEVSGGSDFVVAAGPWIGEVAAARARNLLDDVTAALPAE